MKSVYPELYKRAEEIRQELKAVGNTNTKKQPSGLMTKNTRGNSNG
jgi:hypothetical protein